MNGDNNNREMPLDLTGQQFGRLQVLSRSKTSINKHSAWKCKCLCGNIIEVRGDSLTSGNTTSCGCLKSRGEEKIGEMLRKLNLPYVKEKTFPTCLNPKTQAKLRFDFFVNEEYLIEFDGNQHFEASEQGWNTKNLVQETKYRDSIKNQWCLSNKIPLIRIPYTQINNLQLKDLQLQTSKFIYKEKLIMSMKPNTLAVLNYLKENHGKDMTAADVAEVLGLEKRQIDGIFTSAIQRKQLGFREEAEITLADNSHQKVKYLRLNEAGLAFDPDAE